MKQICIYLMLMMAFSIEAKEWTLCNCMSYANSNNRELIEKIAKYNISKAEESVEYANLLPKFDLISRFDHYWKIPVQSYPAELLGGEEGTTLKVPIGTPWMSDYGINMSWNIFDMESVNKIKLSVLQRKASNSSLDSYSEVVEKNVTLAFYTAQVDEIRMNLSKKHLDDYKLIHELIMKQLEKGYIDRISLNQSENILSDCRYQYLSDSEEYNSSLINLKFWMGYPMNEELDICNNYELPLPNNYKSFVAERLPEYTDYENNILIAKQQRRLASSILLPKITLLGNYGQTGFGNTAKELYKNRWYTSGYIGFSLTFPVFSYKDYKKIQKQSKLITQKLCSLDAYVELQRKEFMIKNIELNRSWEDIRIKQEKSRRSEESLFLSLQKVKQEIVDITQLQLVQRELSESENQLHNATIEYIRHYIDIHYLQNND